MAIDPRLNRPAPFWPLVWQIALGIFFGSLLTSVVGGVVGAIGWQILLSSMREPPPPRPAAATVEEINGMILGYKAATADGTVTEREKAEAARAVADAFRTRKDRRSVEEWEDKARIHDAAGEAGKRTKPVR